LIAKLCALKYGAGRLRIFPGRFLQEIMKEMGRIVNGLWNTQIIMRKPWTNSHTKNSALGKLY
jgi:hypothetical protein